MLALLQWAGVSVTRRTTATSIDAHSLGVRLDPSDDDMATLERYSRQELISRHQAQLQRLHEGIRLRAVEHVATVEGLRTTITGLQRSKEGQRRMINNLWLGVAACAMVVAYFVVRNMSCPIMPWNYH